jgi:phosphocarrier protein FPr
MVGIVVVSHSSLLAEGVVALANQMTQGRCNIAAAGGVDDPDNPIGTDTIRIMSAIEEVFDDSGVLVMMDMGSALLSTETALELIDPDMAEKVTLCSAPIVEGTMAASVAASAGLPMSAVLEEAAGCLAAKREHLGEMAQTSVAEVKPVELVGEVLQYTHHVLNPHGLHARPAAAVVGVLAPFESDVRLEKGGVEVNAKSLNSIAKLGVKVNDVICLSVCGPDAIAAIDAFKALANTHFGESIEVTQESDEEVNTEVQENVRSLPVVDGLLSGIAVCDGIAIGNLVRLDSAMPDVPKRAFTSEMEEVGYLNKAIDIVCSEMLSQASLAEKTLGHEQAGIFKAHILMLSDPEIQLKIKDEIRSGAIAEAAFMAVMSELARDYASADSDYMRERESDVWDVTRQTMLAFDGHQTASIELENNSIIVAKDLSPAQTAQLDVEKVTGICLEAGGKTAHSAIIARAMGIPCVVKVVGCLDATTSGQAAILDGSRGHLWLEPNEEITLELTKERQAFVANAKAKKDQALNPAVTLNGLKVDIQANIGGLEDVKAALENGAEGVGLLRTEFVFQSKSELPSEDEQYVIYRDIAAALGHRPLTIRSLDVGGDKPLSSYPMVKEDNPFLGLRGVRLCLADIETLFKPQLKAILRAVKEQPNIQLMIPMISEVSELIAVKHLLLECRQELDLPEHRYPMNVGIMIEVPAAVFNADELAKEADFFSIGTNDLTQYVMAADRGNSAVASLVDYKKSAVLAAIKTTCEAAIANGIAVSMCGEMAGDVEMSEQLINYGVHKLSASASLLPSLKAKIRQI